MAPIYRACIEAFGPNAACSRATSAGQGRAATPAWNAFKRITGRIGNGEDRALQRHCRAGLSPDSALRENAMSESQHPGWVRCWATPVPACWPARVVGSPAGGTQDCCSPASAPGRRSTAGGNATRRIGPFFGSTRSGAFHSSGIQSQQEIRRARFASLRLARICCAWQVPMSCSSELRRANEALGIDRQTLGGRLPAW